MGGLYCELYVLPLYLSHTAETDLAWVEMSGGISCMTAV